jgi:hypothetical protein
MALVAIGLTDRGQALGILAGGPHQRRGAAIRPAAVHDLHIAPSVADGQELLDAGPGLGHRRGVVLERLEAVGEHRRDVVLAGGQHEHHRQGVAHRVHYRAAAPQTQVHPTSRRGTDCCHTERNRPHRERRA